MNNAYDEMRKELLLSGFSKKTRKTYLDCMQRLSDHYGVSSPETISKEQVKDFLVFLIEKRNLSLSSIKQYYHAIRFFFLNIHGKEMMDGFPKVKGKILQLPQALARSEVKAILDSLTNLKHKTILLTTYSAGLRVSEVTHLHVTDIDSKRMLIRVSRGKGMKDRYTLLSGANLKYLREYYKQYRPTYWLFNGWDKNKPISIRTVEKVFTAARQKAGINKDVAIHVLRHSFATHLIESGIDIHHIQKFLGHSSIKTTAIYLHLTHNKLFDMNNPLDFPEL